MPVTCDQPRAAELPTALELVVRQQAKADRRIHSVGLSSTDLVADLEALDPPWTSTVRIVRRDDAVAGVVVVEWSTSAGTAWIHGPWVEGPDDSWATTARLLVDCCVAQLPDAISGCVLTGDAEHRRLAETAAELGWSAGVPNHIMVATADVAARWSDRADGPTVRPATAADLPTIRRLHDEQFPSTYFSAEQLLDRHRTGDHTVLVAEQHGLPIGYVAGQVQPDGDGYVDFLAVDADHRGAGAGRALVAAVAADVIPRSDKRRICLTVRADREPAVALYERLGFVREASLVAYEGTPDRGSP